MDSVPQISLFEWAARHASKKLDTRQVNTQVSQPLCFIRECIACGQTHQQLNSPICTSCRYNGSKKECPYEGCTTLIGLGSHSCLVHRSRFQRQTYTQCFECGCPIESSVPACPNCRENLRILCACGCGRYRRKYGSKGQVCCYVSGHNDNWATNRRPLKKCDICGHDFRSKTIRQRICSAECRDEWLRINPPKERKRIAVICGWCGTHIYRAPHQVKPGRAYACSKSCRYNIVAMKARKKPSIQIKRLALQRDHGKCAVCKFDILVEVHHIIPRRYNGPDTLENLISLCPTHHTMADRNMITQETLYGYIAKAAMVNKDNTL